MLQKFKEWLIIKLGGRLQPPPMVGKVVNVQPMDVHGNAMMDSRYMSNPTMYAGIKDQAVLGAVYKIAEMLYFDGWFEVIEEDEPALEARNIKLTLWVMPPNWKQRG